MMRRPWEPFLSLGIVHPMVFPETVRGDGPILETLERLLSDGFFSAVEITTMRDPAVRTRARERLRAAGMDVIFVGQAPILLNQLNPNSLDEAERGRAIEALKGCVDAAYEMNAAMLAIMSGPDPGAEARPAAMELLADSVQQLCRYAEARAGDHVLTLSLETFDRAIEKKCLIGPTAEAVWLCERVKQKHDHFGLTIDQGHLPLIGESCEECIHLCIDHLLHAHAGNCVLTDKSHPLYGDRHPGLGVPGGENGVAELAAYLDVLWQAGYFRKQLPTRRPVLSFEVKPMPGESSADVIAGVQDAMGQAWDEFNKKRNLIHSESR